MLPFRVAFRRLFAIRLAGTVSVRYAYLFLPTIADGLDVSLAAVGVAIACGEVTGLGAPFFGRLIDRLGRRRGMRDGCLVAAVGCALAAATPSIIGLAIALPVVYLGRFTYDVSLGAWIGDEVPYARRGRATGIAELAWSGALFLGVPIAGVLTDLWSWRVPYAVSAVVLLASSPIVARTLPVFRPTAIRGSVTPRAAWARPRPLHGAVFILSLGAAMMFASEGAWFEIDLGFSEREVAVVVILLGVGEIVGSLLSALVADHWGKRNAMVVGTVFLGVMLGAVTAVGSHQVIGVVLAIGVGLAFELAFVSALPLAVEVAGDERAGSLGLTVAALTGARTTAALMAPALFDARGIDEVMVAAVAAAAVAVTVLLWRVREPRWDADVVTATD